METISDQFSDHQRVVAAASSQRWALEQMADRIAECFLAGGRLFLCGNGGSAADAQHIAAEFIGRFRRERKALPALALTTDTSVLTAVGNDLGAEQCFSRQVEALVTQVDVLWALSTSGRSPNVLRALEAARRAKAFCIGFTGRMGKPMMALCDLSFQADSDRPDRIQEVHQLAYHLVCDRVEQRFSGG